MAGLGWAMVWLLLALLFLIFGLIGFRTTRRSPPARGSDICQWTTFRAQGAAVPVRHLPFQASMSAFRSNVTPQLHEILKWIVLLSGGLVLAAFLHLMLQTYPWLSPRG